jgi:hypothetical protein
LITRRYLFNGPPCRSHVKLTRLFENRTVRICPKCTSSSTSDRLRSMKTFIHCFDCLLRVFPSRTSRKPLADATALPVVGPQEATPTALYRYLQPWQASLLFVNTGTTQAGVPNPGVARSEKAFPGYPVTVTALPQAMPHLFPSNPYADE